jgi:hypothetical protein
MATPILTTKLHIPSPPQSLVPRERLISQLDRGAPGKLIRGSFEMFGSILGTWLPFALIFTASYLTGRFMYAKFQRAQPGSQAIGERF